VPPPAGVASPIGWGTEEHLRDLFPRMRAIRSVRKHFAFRYESASHFVDVFRRFYGPTHVAFGKLDSEGQARLGADIVDLCARFSRRSTTLVVPAEYLETVIER
jgi:hypothetical protein